jgi:tetratricopeptide (TPR) repeat protein
MHDPRRVRVQTQHPRDYTVQIRVAGTEEIVGTGVIIDADRVVTCAHVVRDAGVELHTGGDPAESGVVDVYYPQAAGSSAEKTRTARVRACFAGTDDDVVLLALDASAPIGPERYAELGEADPSAGHPFRAYGYKRLGQYQAGHAYGTVMGCVECPPDFVLQTDPVELDSPHLAAGMSGAGVLDTERNLVVGLVSEVFYAPDDKNRDVGWAVDARVLAFDPLNLPLAEDDRPKQAVTPPPALPDPRMALLRPTDPIALHGAPPVLDEWVGREDLLAALTRDRDDPDTTITALIGFGGEGKSSLARKWLSTLLRRANGTPQGRGLEAVFWWSFYDEPSAESFFEALLAFLSGGRIDPRTIPGTSARMKLAARMLHGCAAVLVLDGFEVMQHQHGDDYGLIRSADLRAFLAYLAAPESATFTLITSRAPLLDLMPYTTATQRDVTRLSPADGRALLRALGVKGRGADLDRVVRAWDGHALTLSLLGGLLAERYDGDLRRLDDLPAPTADEDRYERVHRVLRRYDAHLTEAERAFLEGFSAFRTPVRREALDAVYPGPSAPAPAPPLDDLLPRLVAYSILRYDARAGTYTAHPLIRNHYFARFTAGSRGTVAETHARIKDVYLELAGDTPRYPSLDDLRPLIEVVHHACRAGAYDEAFNDIYWERIAQRDRFVVVHQLGAYETDLATMSEFFPRTGGAPDLTADPQVSDPGDRRWILNAVGFRLMSLGRLREAVPFYERVAQLDQELADDWHNASVTIQNLAALHLHLGDLDAGATAAREALRLARRAENQEDECDSLAYLAWAEHLQGQTDAALDHFTEAEALETEIDSRKQYLYSLRGIQHADALLRSASPPPPLSPSPNPPLPYARRITEANLEICERNRWPDDLSRCHRVLGDLDAAEGHPEAARAHYDAALRIARSITLRFVLIEALIGRGCFTGRAHVPSAVCPTELPLPQAFADLREALDMATQGGYRRYEADARTALAWAHLASGDSARARTEAARARAMSDAMGYHWGKVDADAVLAAL